MEKELESKIFFFKEYFNKEDMDEAIKKYIKNLKNMYLNFIVIQEYYQGKGILIRVIQRSFLNKNIEQDKETIKEDEIDEYIYGRKRRVKDKERTNGSIKRGRGGRCR